MLDRLARHPHFCFLDGYSGYNQIAIAPEDQEKTTFTCPFGPRCAGLSPVPVSKGAPIPPDLRLDPCSSGWIDRISLRCDGVDTPLDP